MWHGAVGGLQIKGKTSAKLVVHAAFRHRLQRGQDHCERVAVGIVIMVAHQEVVDTGERKLGRLPETAQLGVEDAAETEISALYRVAAGDVVSRTVSQAPVF